MSELELFLLSIRGEKMTTLLLAFLLPFLQGVEEPPSEETAPEKVEDPDLLQEGVRTYQIPPVKRVSFEGKDLSTAEILRMLGKQTGLNITWKYVDEEKLLSVSWKDLTPLEAFDALCLIHQDLHYTIRMERLWDKKSRSSILKGIQVHFMRGDFPEAPTSYVRHYRMTLNRLTLTRETNYVKPKNEGRIQVKLLWTPDVLPRLLQSFKVGLLEDDQGNSLMNSETNRYDHRRSIQTITASREQYLTITFPFSYPPNGVKKLSRLKGTFLLRYPGKMRELTIGDLEGDPPQQEFRGVTVGVEDFRLGSSSVHIKVKVEGVWEAPLDPHLDPKNSWKDPYPFEVRDIFLFMEDGKALSPGRSSFQSGKNTRTFSLEFKNPEGKKVKDLRILCAEKFSYDKVSFEWNDVELPNSK